MPPNHRSVEYSNDTAKAPTEQASDNACAAVEEVADDRLPTLTDELHGSCGSVCGEIQTNTDISHMEAQCHVW